ncbi:hypothetical protein T492DRAFT_402550 [Pavlovales sp. CCMP2436]|nr:hypothetical protein T492DRAFT_402550 [Pavlovales sp. CCMP2436]
MERERQGQWQGQDQEQGQRQGQGQEQGQADGRATVAQSELRRQWPTGRGGQRQRHSGRELPTSSTEPAAELPSSEAAAAMGSAAAGSSGVEQTTEHALPLSRLSLSLPVRVRVPSAELPAVSDVGRTEAEAGGTRRKGARAEAVAEAVAGARGSAQAPGKRGGRSGERGEGGERGGGVERGGGGERGGVSELPSLVDAATARRGERAASPRSAKPKAAAGSATAMGAEAEVSAVAAVERHLLLGAGGEVTPLVLVLALNTRYVLELNTRYVDTLSILMRPRRVSVLTHQTRLFQTRSGL